MLFGRVPKRSRSSYSRFRLTMPVDSIDILKRVRKLSPDRDKRTYSITREVHETVKSICAKEKVSISILIEDLLRNFIDDYQKKHQKS